MPFMVQIQDLESRELEKEKSINQHPDCDKVVSVEADGRQFVWCVL